MKRQGGFSLTELLIVMAVSVILLAGMASFFSSQARTTTMQVLTVDTVHRARTALASMTKEIRMAGYRSSGTAFTGISQATAGSIRILADINQDGWLDIYLCAAGNIDYDYHNLLYISNGNNFSFGIDPDCHYYNDKVTFTITTDTRAVPDGACAVEGLRPVGGRRGAHIGVAAAPERGGAERRRKPRGTRDGVRQDTEASLG